MQNDFKITDFNYIMSALGNAYFSGLTFSELWDCVAVSKTREEFDLAVETCIKLKELVKSEN